MEIYRRRNKKGSITIVRKSKQRTEDFSPKDLAIATGILGATGIGLYMAKKHLPYLKKDWDTKL